MLSVILTWLYSQILVARKAAVARGESLETVLLRSIAVAKTAKQQVAFMAALQVQALESWGTECGRSFDLLHGAPSERQESTKALQWLVENRHELAEMPVVAVNAVFEAAVEAGHVLSLNREMELAHAMCPIQFTHEAFADSLMVSKSDLGNKVLEACGLECLLRVSETRSIFASKAEWPEEFVFMGGAEAPFTKALKGIKYAKASVSPMSMIAEMAVEKDDVLVAPELADVLESVIDGQGLIALSVVMTALRRARNLEGGFARKSWHRLKAEDMVGRVFIGRLFIPELGLAKGGFLVVEDDALCLEGRQYALVTSEIKTEVMIQGECAILCSASKLKKPKVATFDLQNTVMSLNIRCPEATAFIRQMVADQKAARESGVALWMEKIQEDADFRVDICRMADDMDSLAEGGLKEVAIAKVLMSKGIKVESVPSLFASLMSQAGDGNFDADRFRIQGFGFDDQGKKIVYRQSNYVQAAYGHTILELEKTMGRSAISDETRAFYEAQCALAVDEIMVSPEVYDRVIAQHGTGLVYLTRRPMTLTGGVKARLVRGPECMNKLNGLMICSPDARIGEYLLEPSDGADFDDSFEVNFGILGRLMSEWHDEKHAFLAGSMSGKEVQSNLKRLAGSEEFFGLRLPIHLMDWRGLEDDVVSAYQKRVRAAHKGAGRNHKRFSMQSVIDMLGDLKAQPAKVDPVELWQKPTVLEDMSAWMGSAANAQMFATFVLQGFVFPENHPYRAKAEEVATNMVSIMLSDIIDAVNQGAKVEEACDNMLALQAGMLMLAEYAMRAKHIELDLPDPARKRAIWTFANLLKDVTYNVKQDGERVYEFVNGRQLEVTKTFTPNNLKWRSDGWEMQNCLEEYISWFADFVEARLLEGRKTGQLAKLGRAAAAALAADGGCGKARSAANKAIVEAQKERARRSRTVAKHGLTKDSIMTAWANKPMAEAMSGVLDNKDLARQVMLQRMSSWERFDAKGLKVNIDASTLGVRLENAGDRTAMYGDVDGKDGLWRYMLSFLMEENDAGKPTSVTVYPVDRDIWSDGPKVMEAAKTAETGKDLLAQFRLVNKDNAQATATNIAMHRMRISKSNGSQEAYQKALVYLEGLKVVAGSQRYSYNEKVGCWQLTLDLVH